MTKEERELLDTFFKERTKHEVTYLKEHDANVNENGVYVYHSANGDHSIRLDLFLRSYRDWLIDHKIVKQIEP